LHHILDVRIFAAVELFDHKIVDGRKRNVSANNSKHIITANRTKL